MAKKYYYLSVRYDDEIDGFGYRYISDDKTIKVGDRVLVTRQDEEITGIVIEAKSYNYSEVPYPVEYTKKIIRKVDKNYKAKSNQIKGEPGSFYDTLYSCLKTNKEFDVYSFKYSFKDDIKLIDGFEENLFQRKPKINEKTYILNKLNNCNNKNVTSIVKALETYFDKHKCYTYNYISIIYDFSNNSIDKDILYSLGISLVLYPRNIELVKMGILFLSAFIFPENSNIFQLFDDLSHIESLGYYLSVLYSRQKNSDELLIKASQNVSSWGKINYIEEMNFNNENTLKYVLSGGYNNDIGTFQIVGTIINKTSLIKAFNKYIDDKIITNNILDLVISLNDGPNYIGDWKKNTKFLKALIKNKKKFSNNIKFYILLNIYSDYFDNKDDKTDEDLSCILEINKIKSNKNTSIYLKNIVNNGTIEEVEEVCRFLMNYDGEYPTKEIFEFYKKHNKNYYGIILSFLLYFDEYRDKTYKIVIKNINKYNYNSNPESKSYSNSFKFNLLDYVIKDIENYPFYDNNIISKAIMSQNISSRTYALETLYKWMKDSKIKFDSLPEELKNTMNFIKEKEMIKYNKRIINKIIGIKEDLKNYKEPKIIKVFNEE